MEQFYIQMNSIDELTYVVEPVDISTKHNYRVIKLGNLFVLRAFLELEFNRDICFTTENRVYMKIKIDPMEPKSITAAFYGPSKSIERYRKMYLDRIDDWNANDDIYRNLLKIFGNFFVLIIIIILQIILHILPWLRFGLTFLDLMTFPQRSIFDNNTEEYCNICYTYRMAGQIPIVSCDNEKCSLIFHTICLKEWFTTLRDARTFLNMTSGRCPSCKEVCGF